ncbi:hypothetical protein M9H77_21984 [Catharanthus roseus]|uniref:Uncharacterized protein n=1 Tax=Catharanthus roseus TaxID=4058 RepID=A0ACC0APW9_CATRO|nr:hypothetical protein M9H77_21984 [Catharanthus roseus]
MSSPMTWSRAKKMQEVLSHFICKAHAKEGIKVQDYKPKLVNFLVEIDQGSSESVLRKSVLHHTRVPTLEETFEKKVKSWHVPSFEETLEEIKRKSMEEQKEKGRLKVENYECLCEKKNEGLEKEKVEGELVELCKERLKKIEVGNLRRVPNPFDSIAKRSTVLESSYDLLIMVSPFQNILNHIEWSFISQFMIVLPKEQEAEYIAASSCYTQLLWMKQMLNYYGITKKQLIMFCKNTTAISITKNSVQHSKTKTALEILNDSDSSFLISTARVVHKLNERIDCIGELMSSKSKIYQFADESTVAIWFIKIRFRSFGQLMIWFNRSRARHVLARQVIGASLGRGSGAWLRLGLPAAFSWPMYCLSREVNFGLSSGMIFLCAIFLGLLLTIVMISSGPSDDATYKLLALGQWYEVRWHACSNNSQTNFWSHVRRMKKDAYYVASLDGPGLIITTVQLKENENANNYAEWTKAMRLALREIYGIVHSHPIQQEPMPKKHFANIATIHRLEPATVESCSSNGGFTTKEKPAENCNGKVISRAATQFQLRGPTPTDAAHFPTQHSSSNDMAQTTQPSSTNMAQHPIWKAPTSLAETSNSSAQTETLAGFSTLQKDSPMAPPSNSVQNIQPTKTFGTRKSTRIKKKNVESLKKEKRSLLLTSMWAKKLINEEALEE